MIQKLSLYSIQHISALTWWHHLDVTSPVIRPPSMHTYALVMTCVFVGLVTLSKAAVVYLVCICDPWPTHHDVILCVVQPRRYGLDTCVWVIGRSCWWWRCDDDGDGDGGSGCGDDDDNDNVGMHICRWCDNDGNDGMTILVMSVAVVRILRGGRVGVSGCMLAGVFVQCSCGLWEYR